jgi:histidyl-tRNA synthetase
VALIVGEAERAAGTVVVRDLAAGTQTTEPTDQLLARATASGTIIGGHA